jgi:phage terminase large subunit-like protein
MISAPPIVAQRAPRRARAASAPRARPKRQWAPFTLPHFRTWASDLILDSGASWHPEDWQEAFAEDLFAGIPECWLVVPEGNGKTTLVAGLALYHCEFRPFASVPVAASSREQAEILYRQAEGFVLRSEPLYAPAHSAIAAAKGKRKTEVPRFLCLEGYRRINHHGGGRIQVFAADDRTGDGVIPTLGIIEEAHRHRDLSLYRTWAGKLLKRDGQIATLSTAGEPGTDFERTRTRIHETADMVTRKGSYAHIRAGRIALHEWAVPETADPADMAVVKAANPFSGITKELLTEKFATPTMTLDHWLRFVCNRPTRGENAAITEAEWAGAKTDEAIAPGRPIWLGLDVAWKWDTTAAVPLDWRSSTDLLLGPATVLVPPRDGNSLDPDLVEDALLAIHHRNPVHTVVMDTSRAEQLAVWITRELGANVVDRAQTNQWAVQDYDYFMEALRSGWLHHSGDEALTAHVMNAVAKLLPYGDTRFDRPTPSRTDVEAQERRVIDALTAASMVLSVAAVSAAAPAEPQRASSGWV